MRRECRERFPPPPISKETVSWRSRHASRHVRDARAVMHVGIAWLWWRGKRSRHSRRMRTRKFAYPARGPWSTYEVCYKQCMLNPIICNRTTSFDTRTYQTYHLTNNIQPQPNIRINNIKNCYCKPLLKVLINMVLSLLWRIWLKIYWHKV